MRNDNNIDSIKNRKSKLKRSILLTYILMLTGYILGYIIYISAVVYVFPIVQFLLILLKVDFVVNYFVMLAMNLFF